MKEVWKVYLQGLRFPKQVSSRSELWVFLRRVAGGLTAGRQWHLYQEFSPYLQESTGLKKGKGKGKLPKRLNPQEELEIWMAMANFERLPTEAKISLGRILVDRLKRKTRPQEIWALSRLGSRVPLYGPVDRVIPGEVASDWLKATLSLDVRSKDALAHAVVQMARLTGDRERDVPPDDLSLVSRWLEESGGYDSLREILVNGERTLSRNEQDWIFGEALPPGLVFSEPSATDL
jgi:hypothetical protein